MAGVSLLALIDDIATVLDDVAILSKVAAKKTAGVLGDDLALNAEQVSGVKAERELPVVWAVAKGSFVNKLILVPMALLISAVYPPLITILMIIGGLFLCFEGAEKVTEKLMQTSSDKTHKLQEKAQQLSDKTLDLVKFEQAKIKGAIRTDFILSAEIVVIVLGSVKTAEFETQVLVLSSLALAFTVGVYGIVAAIVKLDDLGLYLLRKSVSGRFNRLQKMLGRALLISAPALMKALTVIGTLAMFLVGGGIISHNFSWLHHLSELFSKLIVSYSSNLMVPVAPIVFNAIVGLIAGLIVMLIVNLFKKVKQAVH
ncbi:DUF808 domain-containing protein [Thalassotalea sp. G2M2-11]|uniref:DUF808 domain-containing protein n=1 Tax=Thalassotalea sp. G2M2-11 TaxID=2787627 RepID=UPI0019D00511|nr:DUF808 domain-containing protein [Thalassotalea sp. G2M2-11]